MRKRKNLIAATILAALASGTALADGQRTSVMLWGSALDGAVTIGPATADVDMSLEDILDVLDGSITLRHEADGSDFGWYGEFVYNDLKQEADGPLGVRQANLEQAILELGLSKPIAEGWAVYGGLRTERIENSIDFAVPPSVAASVDWTDVLVGARWRIDRGDARYWVRGDIAGGGSDGAFLFEAGGAWGFGDGWEFSFAWRALDTEYRDGGAGIDLLQSGAVIGVGKRW